MRRSAAVTIVVLLSFAASQTIRRPLSLQRDSDKDRPRVSDGDPNQRPLLHLPHMAPFDPPGQGSVRLSDVMSRDKSINIFAGFARDVASTEKRLEDSAQNTTVLAPLNSAVESLPRKPWEDPKEYGELGADAYEGEDGQERATKNLRRFVEAHMVPASPWKEGDRVKPIGDSREVWWEEKNGTRYASVSKSLLQVLLTDCRLQIQPGDIEVVDVGTTVANGEVVSGPVIPNGFCPLFASSRWCSEYFGC